MKENIEEKVLNKDDKILSRKDDNKVKIFVIKEKHQKKKTHGNKLC